MQVWSDETVQKWRTHYNDAASYWAKWADQLAEQQDKVNRGLLAAAGVKPGSKLLDLASGAGEPAVTAAGAVGIHGLVTATDVSAPMVAVLAERVERLQLQNVRCLQADMERLQFDDASFDAATCRYGLMYVQDPLRAVREAARVVRPGARIAFMVWGPEESNSVVFHGLRAANEYLGNPIGKAEFLAPARFSEPGVLAAMLKAAGLLDVHDVDLVFEPKIRVGLPFWAPLLEMNAADIWGSLTPERRKQVHHVVAAAYEPFRQGDHYVLATHMKMVSGARPAPKA